MQKRWQKLGLFIEPDPSIWWWQTHAMVPTVLELGDGLFRVYFSGRDQENRSHIGYVVIDVSKTPVIVETCDEPVLSPGLLGCFDDNGVTPSCVIQMEDKTYLYYIGWNPGSTVAVHLYGGLAISDDGGLTFSRWSKAPILERTKTDPYLNTAPWVIKQKDGWRLYYVSGVGWDSKATPYYKIKTAFSQDAIEWKREGDVCIDFRSPDESRLARPCVRFEDGMYKMWFACATENYRIGYAESRDGISWLRMDEDAGIDVSETGWDSEMIEYACVFQYQEKRFMFYNGNQYGFDGAGLAIMTDAAEGLQRR